MSVLVFVAVLCAAALHAVWNALVKASGDKELNMTAVVLGHAPAATLVLMLATPPNPASYPYIAAGVALHVGYQFFLLWAYRAGDLTQVYPVARGSAPLIIAAVSVSALGVVLSPMQGVAILVIAAGLLSLALVRRDAGTINVRAAGFAFATGCFIAAYSLVDGLGARAAAPHLVIMVVLHLLTRWRSPARWRYTSPERSASCEKAAAVHFSSVEPRRSPHTRL